MSDYRDSKWYNESTPEEWVKSANLKENMLLLQMRQLAFREIPLHYPRIKFDLIHLQCRKTHIKVSNDKMARPSIVVILSCIS